MCSCPAAMRCALLECMDVTPLYLLPAQLLPVENVDGRAAWEAGDLCLRKTAKGVDLNRNYPFGFASEVGLATVNTRMAAQRSSATESHSSSTARRDVGLVPSTHHARRSSLPVAPSCLAAPAQRDVRRGARLQRAAEPHDCAPSAQRGRAGPRRRQGEERSCPLGCRLGAVQAAD
jgi:hypothetical protein